LFPLQSAIRPTGKDQIEMKAYYLLLTLPLFGCSSMAIQQSAAESPEKESALEMSRDVHWMRNSAEYKAIVLQIYQLAGIRLGELVADKNPGTWAVSMDFDETVID
jgi:predicted secreted acid phosphatase